MEIEGIYKERLHFRLPVVFTQAGDLLICPLILSEQEEEKRRQDGEGERQNFH